MKSSDAGATDPRENARVDAAMISIREVLCGLYRERSGTAESSAFSLLAAGADTDDVLTNLYVAGLHLHSSFEVNEVLLHLREILINFIGADRFHIYFVDRAGERLHAIADETRVRPACAPLPLDEGIIGVVARTGIPYFDTDESATDDAHPRACIPLKMANDVIGVIRVDRLLPQKDTLHGRDHELLNLISEHAAPALVAAAMHEWLQRQADGAGGGVRGILSEVFVNDMKRPRGETETRCER